jgi:hypothetical protein
LPRRCDLSSSFGSIWKHTFGSIQITAGLFLVMKNADFVPFPHLNFVKSLPVLFSDIIHVQKIDNCWPSDRQLYSFLLSPTAPAQKALLNHIWIVKSNFGRWVKIKNCTEFSTFKKGLHSNYNANCFFLRICDFTHSSPHDHACAKDFVTQSQSKGNCRANACSCFVSGSVRARLRVHRARFRLQQAVQRVRVDAPLLHQEPILRNSISAEKFSGKFMSCM